MAKERDLSGAKSTQQKKKLLRGHAAIFRELYKDQKISIVADRINRTCINKNFAVFDSGKRIMGTRTKLCAAKRTSLLNIQGIGTATYEVGGPGH